MDESMQLLVIPTSSDKPVKIVLEDKATNAKAEQYQLTLKEVLTDILRHNWKLRETLSPQQIHSERGKVKRNNCDEVVNFLIKRGVSKSYIDNEVNQKRDRRR